MIPGHFKGLRLQPNQWLDLHRFREMDYFALDQFDLTIELMMENAGLHLARVIASNAQVGDGINLGVGNGNNGGGGLVAARRLAAWGYNVHLDIPVGITKDLPSRQLERALKFGVNDQPLSAPKIWVDAYLGFSMRLPLSEHYSNRVKQANECAAYRISLDIPTGFLGHSDHLHFKADTVLMLAAAKSIMKGFNAQLLVADLGIPKEVYQQFQTEILPFYNTGIIKVKL